MAGWWRPRARAEQRLSKEIEFHLAERVAELVADGHAPDDAARQARIELGALDPILEGCRDQRWWRGLDDLGRDIRYALRTLRQAPVFALIAILTLTLGIGANAALFQVYEALVLRVLPVPDAAQLHIIRVRPGTPRNGNFNGHMPHLTSAQVDVLRRTDAAANGLAVWSNYSFNLAPAGEVRLAEVLLVSGDYFDVLRLPAQHGRLIGRDDDRPGCGTGAVVLSDAFWRREYGARPGVVGETLRLEGQPFDIVGVAPAGFSGLEVGYEFDVAVPLCADARLRLRSMDSSRQNWWLAAAARLPAGQSLQARTAALEALSPAFFRETLPAEFRPELAGKFLAFKLAAVDASRGVSALRGTFTSPLLMLMGVTGLVLLIACVNLANLLLARMSHRQRELAVRLAVGASRGRLARVVAVETGVLVAAGSACGVLLSTPLSRWLVHALVQPGSPVHLDVRLNWPLLLAATGLAVVVCAISAVAPALRAAAVPPGHALRDGLRATSSAGTLWWRRALIVAEVALTFVLVVGAVLMARTLGRLQSVDLGFDARGLVTTDVSLDNVQDWRGRRAALIDGMVARIGALPFVSGVSTLDYVPVAGSSWNDTLRADGGGHPETPSQLNRVGEQYFEVMGTPLLEGRVFTRQDVPGGVDVAVVNRAVQDTMFGGRSPIGASVRILSEPDRAYQIVGVVGDTKYGSLRETRQPVLFVSTRQQADPGADVSLVIRSRLPVASTMPLVSRALMEIEPAASLRTRALEEIIESTLVVEQLLTRLSLFFGGLALLLAGVGLYGVIAYDAARRQRDIGIRLALGSSRRNVMLDVVGQIGWLLGAGLLTGLAASVPLARWVEGLLYGVTVRDLGTYALSGLALAVVGVAAAWVPAWRASRLNPTSALRST